MSSTKAMEPLGKVSMRARPRSTCEEGFLPLDLEELDRRLESAAFPVSDLHANEPCIWACSCFLVDGGPS
jgi:hypothetical protein